MIAVSLLLAFCIIANANREFEFDGVELRQEVDVQFNIEILGGRNTSSDYDILIVVRSQAGNYHKERLELFESSLRQQINGENNVIFAIVHIHEVEMFLPGSWTILPFLQQQYHVIYRAKWIFICEDSTRVNLSKIASFLSVEDHSKPQYLGRCMRDEEPVIIHHFGPRTTDLSTFDYPLFASGVILSKSLVRYIATFDLGDKPIPQTTIDIQHEIAVLIYVKLKVRLGCVKRFCVENKEFCMSWVDLEQNTGCHKEQFNLEDLSIAVKTHAGNYNTRIPIVQNTWVDDAINITKFYTHSLEKTNEFNGKINFIDVGFPNTGGGHCEKLLFIMKNFYNAETAHWLAVVDDDTFINVERLGHILSCHKANDEALILGEKYGYLQIVGRGYPFITGGGGIILTRRAVGLFIKANVHCAARTPDDMWLGMFGNAYGVNFLNYPNFHQSVATSYHRDYIKCYRAVSYHRISSVREYEESLKD